VGERERERETDREREKREIERDSVNKINILTI